MFKRLLILLVAPAALTGCAPLEPVGHDTAKFHGEQALRSMKNLNGNR